MLVERLKLKIESYFNCSSLLRRDGGEGFTLAEVLIALTVIGVISAVTVPVLMQNTNKQEIVTALKKTYSTLSQVTNQIIAEEGSPKGDEGWADTPEHIYQLYKKHLNNFKECSGKSGCFSQFASERPRRLDGSINGADWDGSSGYRKFIMGGGTQVMIANASKNCNQAAWSAEKDFCGVFWVDINGEKKPNIIGRDIFLFAIKENGLYPAGCSHPENCSVKKSDSWDCTCKVIREDAMNY